MLSKKINTIITIGLALLLAAALFVGLQSAFYVASAQGEATVYFESATFEAADSGLVYAKLIVEGQPKQVINVTYHTETGTAIDGVDYDGIANTVSVTVGLDGKATYTIAIKSRPDYQRQLLRISEGDNVYGRYYSLVIDRADGAVVTRDRCRCYLAYNSSVNMTVTTQGDSEVAYLNDYATMQSLYHKGKGNLDGKKTWKSWKNGVSFNNATSTMWLNTYINTGIAHAYSSYMAKTIDNSTYHSDTDIYVLAGNYEFYRNFDEVKHNIPGCYLYLSFEPYVIYYADRIDGRAMYLISIGKDPFDEDSDLIQVNSADVGANNRRVYWIQQQDAWFAKKGAFTDSVFWRNDPYDGVLDMAWVIWNKNREVDIEFRDLWFFMTLIDETNPTVVGQYLDDSRVASDGKLRMYVRFSEPVYTTKQGSLQVKINNGAIPYYADYVEGNYTDTLVYEMAVPNVNVKSVNFELPDNDICDLAYNLDSYNRVQNNKAQYTDQVRSFTMLNGNVNYVLPRLWVDMEFCTGYRNVYNLELSLNDNGAVDLNEGVIYYKWSKEESIANALDPSSYDVERILYPEENGAISLSLVKNESEGIDSGTYYLHVLAIGKYGRRSTATFGKYVLDGDPPALVQVPLPVNDLKTKTFAFDNNKAGGARIVSIWIHVKWKEGEEWVTRSCPLMTDGVAAQGLSTTDDVRYQYVSNIDPTDEDGDGEPDVRLDRFMLELMGDSPRFGASVSFEAVDSAGNHGFSNAVSVVYDTRETFKASALFPEQQGYLPVTDITAPYPTYNIAQASRGDGDGIVITVAEQDRSHIVEGTWFQVMVGNRAYVSGDDPYSVVIGDLEAGLYQLVPNIVGVAAGSEVDLVANPISFYLTDGFKDSTANKLASGGNLVLAGKVFLLEDVTFYYLDRADKVSNHLYGASYNSSLNRYEGGATSPAFSSVGEARKYVRYMEYQDLHLVSLTDNQASVLNSSMSATTYTKAAGETRTARQGQLWIRYKKSSWTTSSNAYGWSYYYYSEEGDVGAGIDLNRLSSNLLAAMDAVVTRIVSAGDNVYLIRDNYLDQRTDAPYLALSQIHVQAESVSTTKTGVSFVAPPSYAGDGNIYRNTVTIEDVEYPLATNMAFRVSADTALYYHYYESTEWQPLNIRDGQLLSEVWLDLASGIYTIREYDAAGVSEFDIYFDKVAPTIRMNLNDEEYILDGTIVNFSGNSASLLQMLNEVDPYGYVAVYSYPSRILRGVLYADDIAHYDLGSENYYLQAGDRSGNITMYTVLLSNTQLAVSIAKSEAQSGIVIRVDNRDETEIYAYEVYLNEELLTSEFVPFKVCRDPGVYRVVVMDIYGNTYSEIYEYEFPSPQINWYYLNSSGGYAKYDPNNIVNMMLVKDQANSRVTNVFTSTRVRLMFDLNYGDSAIRFEMLDIPAGAYSYSDATGVMSINTDDSWRLRVWFEDYPQNDHIYACRLDADAPDFIANFVGTSYVTNLSLDDPELLDRYEISNVISLDTLTIEEGANTTLSFLDGGIISGSHITIGLFDPAGIRTYSVTRNGQSLSLSLNEEGQIVLNNYGHYVVTAVDALGNKSTFSFINLKDPLATATVDGQSIDEQRAYGRDNLVVTTEYVSTTTILVRSGDVSLTFVFEFDGDAVTYWQYVCALDEETDNRNKYAELVQINGFEMRLSDDAVKRDRWYQATYDYEYTVWVMFDSKGKVNYRVSADENVIDVEMLVSVGNNKRPSLFCASLSKKSPALTLLCDGHPAEIIEGMDYIYVAYPLTIGSIDADITEIQVGFALTPDAPVMTTIYRDGEYVSLFEGKADGYYTIVATNVYHAQTVYRVQKIKAFSSVVTATYKDGMKKRYLTNVPLVCSNYMIDLLVDSSSVYFEINDEVYEGTPTGHATTISFNRPGRYDVRIVASNGVFEHFTFEIASNPGFVFSEDWITGYNENALLRDEGYTNTFLTPVLTEGVEYIDYEFDGTTFVLYDNVAENKTIDVSALSSAIGRKGNGVYKVNFRNSYGDVAYKEIHHSTRFSLSVSRKTLANPNEWVSFGYGQVVAGLYSNYAVRFATESTNYDFRVNDVAVSLEEPRIYELDLSSGNGSFGYQISYIDEYGNSIRFKAELRRADVTIETPSMEEIVIDGTKYTKDNVSLTFGASYRASVSIDDDAPVAYRSGDVFYRDGTYVFIIEDVAGNRLEYTVIHKSVNHYRLFEPLTEQPVLPGGVVNNSSVVFEPSDNSIIKTIVKNGQVVSTPTNTFSSTGHWELLIVDLLGNTSYAEFYVINNSLGEFTYSAPYNYVIDEVWKTDAKGVNTMLETHDNSIHLTENGDYVISVIGVGVLSSFRFTVTIDNTPPAITLQGVEDKGITARNVSIKGLKSGDVVRIYKNGELVETVDVGTATAVPEITTGGEYRIVVTNLQGVSTEYTFTRKKIANIATSIFLIVLIAMSVAGVTIGLLYHTRQKTDSKG